MIELKHVTAGYGKHTVLTDVSAVFAQGSLTSVIGVNGSGKSTLLKTILDMIPLCAGEILMDGEPLADLSRIEIARKAAYLSQGKTTPDMAVEQLVLHGRFPHLHYPRRYGKQDRELAYAAMEQVGITALARKPLYTLSGGMRQNAYIAMALAQDTAYILLDEPTTYLDISHQLALMGTLRKLADSGKGIIAVMHDLPMAFAFSDRIVLLHDGKIVCNDVPERVCQQNVIREVFGVTIEKAAGERSYHYKFCN